MTSRSTPSSPGSSTTTAAHSWVGPRSFLWSGNKTLLTGTLSASWNRLCFRQIWQTLPHSEIWANQWERSTKSVWSDCWWEQSRLASDGESQRFTDLFLFPRLHIYRPGTERCPTRPSFTAATTRLRATFCFIWSESVCGHSNPVTWESRNLHSPLRCVQNLKLEHEKKRSANKCINI